MHAKLEQHTARAAHTLLEQRNFSNALLKSNAQLEQCRAPAQLLRLHPTTAQPYNTFVDIISLLCSLSPLFLPPPLLIITTCLRQLLFSLTLTPHYCSALQHLCRHHFSLTLTPHYFSALQHLCQHHQPLSFTLSPLCPLHSHPSVLATAAFLTITAHHHCHLFPLGLCSSSILSRSSTLCSHHCFVVHHLLHQHLYSIPALSNPMLLFPIITVCVSVHASFYFVVANT